jgi:hypothetical protein
MPNHVTNIVRFSGPRDQIENLFDLVASEKLSDDPDCFSHLFDFENITPRPEELNCISQIITSNDPHMIRPSLDRDRKVFGWDMTDEQFEERVKRETELAKIYSSNIEKYGYRTWYDWSIANWGTKWNAYDVDFHMKGHFRFDTANNTPQPIFQKLSEMFSEVEITVEYADEDIGYNCGRYSYENGELTEEWQPHGEKATTFALETKGYGEADIEEFIAERKQQQEEG